MTYEMKHSARKHSIDVEADASHLAKQTWHATCLQDSLLKLAQVLGSRVAGQHMLLPYAVVGIRHRMYLRSEVHDDGQAVIAMHVGDLMGRDPWRGAVLGVNKLHVFGQFS